MLASYFHNCKQKKMSTNIWLKLRDNQVRGNTKNKHWKQN